MYYKQFQDLKLSALGVGCMRLPLIDGTNSNIDKEQTAQMIKYAFEHGVNYVDTAWGYHDGNSELVVGEVLKDYPRDSFYLATKFPGYDKRNWGKVEEIFQKQLEKLQTEYFDFYLVHNVIESNVDAYLDEEKYGILPYLIEQKKNGVIKHLGFSAHGSVATMRRYLEKYGDYMEFCQIQLNWLDYEFQDAKGKIELCNEYGLPVWVMEPLRGGRLVNLEDEYKAELAEKGVTDRTVSLAFRFLETLPEVTMILSGMSSFDQMKDNIDIFEKENPLSEEEVQALIDLGAEMTGKIAVPCTACRYCTTHCPKGIPIPDILTLYNEHAFTGGGFIAPMVMSRIRRDQRPDACIGCGSCSAVCPQSIDIPGTLADFVKRLGQ